MGSLNGPGVSWQLYPMWCLPPQIKLSGDRVQIPPELAPCKYMQLEKCPNLDDKPVLCS